MDRTVTKAQLKANILSIDTYLTYNFNTIVTTGDVCG